MDVRAVDKLLTRSLELLDDGHTVRPAVALGLAEALTTMGQPDRVPRLRSRGGGHRDVAVRHGRPDHAAHDLGSRRRHRARRARATRSARALPRDRRRARAGAGADRPLLGRGGSGATQGRPRAPRGRRWSMLGVQAIEVLSDALGWLCGTTIHGPANPATMQDTVATAEQEDGGAYVVVGVEYVRAKLACFEEVRGGPGPQSRGGASSRRTRPRTHARCTRAQRGGGGAGR